MPPRKHEEIAESLTREILEGRYRCGERLPSERDLAVRFDANRGAVREAMKKLEQLGIATIAPGGARVAPLHEASLDVIGHMLNTTELPDPDLLDQIFQVMNSLVSLATESAVQRASDDEIAAIRARLQPLLEEEIDEATHAQARMEVVSALMTASGNLVCRLITRALLAQLAPRMALLEREVRIDYEAHREHARRLDAALASRDADAVRETFASLARLNRESARRAFAALAAKAGRRRTAQPG